MIVANKTVVDLFNDFSKKHENSRKGASYMQFILNLTYHKRSVM